LIVQSDWNNRTRASKVFKSNLNRTTKQETTCMYVCNRRTKANYL